MRIPVRIALAAATAALGAAPAIAVASASERGESAPGRTVSSHGTTTSGTTTTTTTTTSPPPNAYGRLCQNQSKKHVAGTPGTPFSKCVTAMAQVANGSTINPHKACAKESKKHEAGKPGTPYSRCVSAAAKLIAEKHPAEEGTKTSTTG